MHESVRQRGSCIAFVGLFLLVPLFAGCIDPGTDGPTVPPLEAGCTDFTVPNLPLGTEATYNVEGRFVTVQQPWLNLAWSLFDPKSESNLPVFPAGSRIRVQADEEAHERMDQWGRMVPAFQVRYEAEVPDAERKVHFVDEWIEESTGIYIQDHSRTALFIDDHERQFIRTTRTDRPGTLFTSALWGENLTASYNQTVQFPGEWPGALNREPGEGTVDYAVREVGLRDGRCTAHVHIEVEWPGEDVGSTYDSQYPGLRFDMLMEETSALPLWFNASWTHPEGNETFTMERTAYLHGDREEHIPLPGTGTSDGPPWATPVAARKGVPVDKECRFGTCLHNAVDRVTVHPTAVKWFIENPDANIRLLDHMEYGEDAHYRDLWIIQWESGAEQLGTYHLSFKTGDAPQILVNVLESDRPNPPPVTEIISLDDMATLHEAVHGGPPEILTCFFEAVSRDCSVSTHFGAGVPRPQSTDWSAPVAARGVLFGFDGHVHQIDTYDPVLLGPGMA